MKILKGVRIKEKGNLGYLVANICLDEETAQSMKDKAKGHFFDDPRDKSLYKSPFGKKGEARYTQRKRRIKLHTSKGRLGGMVFWRRSLHARAIGEIDFVRGFYNILEDQY